MAEATLSLEQFSDVLRNINPGLGPAASQLWQDGVNTENLLRMLTKEDMQQAGINLGDRVLIYNHYHPIDAGLSCISVQILLSQNHSLRITYVLSVCRNSLSYCNSCYCEPDYTLQLTCWLPFVIANNC